jgi:hypothetical protein
MKPPVTGSKCNVKKLRIRERFIDQAQIAGQFPNSQRLTGNFELKGVLCLRFTYA